MLALSRQGNWVHFTLSVLRAHGLAPRKFSTTIWLRMWVHFSSINTKQTKDPGVVTVESGLGMGDTIYLWSLVVLHKLDLQMSESLLCELDHCLFRAQ